MGKVNVVIIDATGNKEQKVGLPDDVKCGIIMVKLVEKIKLPSVGPDGNPISYKFIHKVTGRQLLEAQTLAEAGIHDGDVLRLQPEITAGAFCPKCGSNVNGPFCPSCGYKMEETSEFSAYSASQQFSESYSQPSYGQQNYEQQNYNANAYNPSSAYNPTPSPAPTTFNNAAPKKNGGTAKKVFSIVGMVSGALSAIFGIIVLGMPTGGWESNLSYGGDAYTGIQNAAAQTANNVQTLTESINAAGGYLLLALGLGMISYFGVKLFSSLEK